MELIQSGESCSSNKKASNLHRDAICIVYGSTNLDAFQVSEITDAGTTVTRYETLNGDLIDIDSLPANHTISSGACCCAIGQKAKPKAYDDDIGAFITGVSRSVNVANNDTVCNSGELTGYMVIAGSEIGCTVNPFFSTDGIFNVIADGNGDPSFKYSIYCNGVDSTSSALAAGKIASLAISKNNNSPVLVNPAVGSNIQYTIAVSNNGTADLENIELLDNNVSFIDYSEPFSLLAGEQRVFNAIREITESDINSGTINNTATATVIIDGTPIVKTSFSTVVIHTIDAVDDFITTTAVPNSAISYNVSSNDNPCDAGYMTYYSFVNGSAQNVDVVTIAPTTTGQISFIPRVPANCCASRYSFQYSISCAPQGSMGLGLEPTGEVATVSGVACKGNKTEAWTITTTPIVKAVATDRCVEITFEPSTGKAGVPAILNQAFSNGTWWSENLAGAAALACNIAWDTSPESRVTLLPDADIGSGILTIKFSCPVKNPILHLDRLGGSGTTSPNIFGIYTAYMNSLSLELISGADSLTRLSGTNHFEVVGKTIRRAYGVYSIPPNPAVQAEASNSITASSAGSVQLNGIVSEVKFKWTGYGVEGIGMDGVHMLVSGLCNIV